MQYPVPPEFYSDDPRFNFRTAERPDHQGVDFQTPVGIECVAAEAGTVIYSADETTGYGNTLTIKHDPSGLQTRYAHLSEVDVTYRDQVAKGQRIGLTGGVAGAPGSGNSGGPHLHFEVRTTPLNPVDPMEWLSVEPAPPSPEPEPEPSSDVPPWPGVLISNYHEGDGVAEWQTRMHERGWSIVIDDKYGDQSEAVCRAFQQEKGLVVDGIVGPITWDAAWTAPIT